MAQMKGLLNLVKNKMVMVIARKDQLNEKVDSYVGQVTAMVRSTLEAEEKDMNVVRELNFTLDSVLGVLMGVEAEVDEVSYGLTTRDSDFSIPSTEVSLNVSELHPAMSQRVATAIEPADISKLFNRLDVLELAVTGCRSEISQATVQQAESKTEMETRQERLETKLEALVTERKEKEESIKNQLLVMEAKRSDTQKQQASRLTASEDFVKQAEVRIVAKMDEMESKLKLEGEQRLTQLEKKRSDTEKQNKARLDDTEDQIKKMESKWKDVMKQSDSRVEKVDKRLKKVEAGEKEDSARIDSLVKTTEKLAAKIDTMAEKGDIVDLMKMSRTTSKSLEELSSRVDATESFVKSSVSYREREENKKRELGDRILVLESNRRKDTNHIMKKVKEVESLFHQVCVIVDQRVTPLRRLLRILNDLHMRVEKREQLSLRLDEVTKQVTEVSGKVSNFETTKQKAPVGFIAELEDFTSVKAGTVITDFKDSKCNEGGHYNPTSGVFVAPRDGIYVTSVSHQQVGDGKIRVHVNHDNASGAFKRAVCRSDTVMNNTSGCGVAFVEMKRGEKLYVKTSFNTTGNVKMADISSFSCFSLG